MSKWPRWFCCGGNSANAVEPQPVPNARESARSNWPEYGPGENRLDAGTGFPNNQLIRVANRHCHVQLETRVPRRGTNNPGVPSRRGSEKTADPKQPGSTGPS